MPWGCLKEAGPGVAQAGSTAFAEPYWTCVCVGSWELVGGAMAGVEQAGRKLMGERPQILSGLGCGEDFGFLEAAWVIVKECDLTCVSGRPL